MPENKMTLHEMARRYVELVEKEEKWFNENPTGTLKNAEPGIVMMMLEVDDFEDLGIATYGEKTFMAEVLRLMGDREEKVA